MSRPVPELEVTALTRRFGGVTALDAVNLTFTTGEVTCLVGPNGSGKSTLVDCVTGVTRPTSGSVRLRGADLGRTSQRARVRAGLRRTFQAVHTFAGLTVLEHMLIAQQETDGVRWLAQVVRSPGLRRAEKTATEKAMPVLELVGLAGRAGDQASALSYGQQKLLGLAIALAGEPNVLCLDEPLAGVSPRLTDVLVGVLGEVRRRGVTLLVVEHDIDFVADISDQVVVLAEGQVVAAGPPSVLSDDVVFATLSGTTR
ncbi:ABC transporter ATP-binding protein [Micromonospora sp. NPDC000316]|uniref:ABC transporter ATP-binding protein n=1 Tax=Micromonospora sp. NPDC000316 TaxID=3364216 RepID=UPI0036B5DC9E